MKLLLFNIITLSPVSDLVKAFANAETDIQSLIKAAAKLISGLTGSVAGMILLFMCLKTAFKARGGNSGAWDEAAETIAICVIVLCFSGAIFTIFF